MNEIDAIRESVLRDYGEKVLVIFDEQIVSRLGNEFFSFNGDENCENCLGWDGIERRCSCGNRRVSWTYDYGYFYGEAY